jgi:hypothetical protein
MKKLILAATITAIAAGSVTAQELTFGPEIGINLSNVSGDVPNTDMKLGLKVGGVVNIPAGGGFYLQPGLFFHQKGYKTSAEILGVKSSGTTNFNYIELPVNILYRVDLGNAGGIFASAGMYAAYAVSGKTKGELGTIKGEEKIKFGSEANELKPFDWGTNFGLGYETPWGVYVRGQYGLGFGNLSNTDNFSVKNNSIQISVGYLLGRN